MTLPPSAGPAESGMSIIEMLIGTLLTAMVVGGLMTMLTGVQFAHSDLDSRTSAHQAARIAMDHIQRDVTLTGIGLSPMLPVFPLIAPRDDGGLLVRYSQEGLVYGIAEDMAQTDRVRLPADHEIEVGDQVAVYDASGSIELIDVAAVTGASVRFTGALSRLYEVGEGAAVAQVESAEYFVEEGAEFDTLMRVSNGGAPQPIATHVRDFEVTYFDDGQAEFDPDTEVRQLRIRMVEVRLVIETDRNRVQAGDRPQFELRSRITPRVLTIMRG